MATYVVGDIQGCFEPFMALLTKLKFNPDTDRLWSVGEHARLLPVEVFEGAAQFLEKHAPSVAP